MDEAVLKGGYRFERFLLDVCDRRLSRDGEPVELSSRYFDALALMVGEQGRLVPKQRFLDEVWKGVPVTDEALTQCIRTLRRALGDDAAAPRFIETVPKHGYRFVAPVSRGAEVPVGAAPPRDWATFRRVSLAGALGGGLAGLIGGLIYGFAAASSPAVGGTSVLAVLLVISTLVGLVGGAGVGVGIASSDLAPSRSWHWSMMGGAAGGLVVGAIVKLLGTDAFNLLLGRAPGAISGAVEGAILGGAIGLGAWTANAWSLRTSMAAAGAGGAAAGAIIALLGGRLMGGSLVTIAGQFPGSRLRLDVMGVLAGEEGFGPSTEVVTGALEGLLFGACLVGAMVVARRGGLRPGGRGRSASPYAADEQRS